MSEQAKVDSRNMISKQRSLWGDALRRLMQNPGSMVGLALLLIVIASALLAPLLTSQDPIAIVAAERLKPPGTAYWFGTDAFGRDIYTRVIYGGRISLRVGIISVAIASLFGVTGGMVAGYFGGRIDTIIMRLGRYYAGLSWDSAGAGGNCHSRTEPL